MGEQAVPSVWLTPSEKPFQSFLPFIICKLGLDISLLQTTGIKSRP